MQWHPSVWVKGCEIEIHFHYFSRIRTEQHGYCKLALTEFICHAFGKVRSTIIYENIIYPIKDTQRKADVLPFLLRK